MITLAKVTTPATVSLAKVTDAAYALRMVRPVTNDLITNNLDALAEVFRIQEIRAIDCAEIAIYKLDLSADGRESLVSDVDAALDTLTRGKYAATR